MTSAQRIGKGVFLGLLFLVVIFMLTGCATALVHRPDGTVVRQRVVMDQVGVILSVKNNCSARLVVERGGYTVDWGVPYGRSNRLPLPSLAYSGDSRSIKVTVSALDQNGKYLGSATYGFYVDTYRGTYEETWVVDKLDSPPGARCVLPEAGANDGGGR